jgi:large conductance mechanosensitive channel
VSQAVRTSARPQVNTDDVALSIIPRRRRAAQGGAGRRRDPAIRDRLRYPGCVRRERNSALAIDRPIQSTEATVLAEFKKFALRGNVVDLAIGVIIGAAFGKIVDSLVGDIFMPIVGAVTGGLDFSNYFVPLSKAVTATALVDARKQGAVLAWGNFLTMVINFLIVAGVLFFFVKLINRLKEE